VAVAVLIVVAVLFLSRTAMPESFLWLQKKGRDGDLRSAVEGYYGPNWEAEVDMNQAPAPTMPARARIGQLGTMVIMIVIAAANTIGFGLMAYALAFDFFPHLQPTILAIFEGAGFVVGFLGLMGDRWSRKRFLFWTFLGTFVMTAIVGLTTHVWLHDMTVFWVLLVVLAGVNSLCYLTEDTLKPEVWPTLQRGTMTAVARFISIGLYIPAIYIGNGLSPSGYILFNAGVWLAGLIAAGFWLVYGWETGAGVSIEAASGEEGAAS
jgi:hypothetical protein